MVEPEGRLRLRFVVMALATAVAGIAQAQTMAAVTSFKGPETGLALPRFISLEAERANVRIGPGKEYRIKWVFTRPGLPLEVIRESNHWRKVRDWQGESGWIHHVLLTSRRVAMVSPWGNAPPAPMRSEPDPRASIVVNLESRVIVPVAGCDGQWCSITVRELDGYIRQDKLWGVYPGETIDSSWLF